MTLFSMEGFVVQNNLKHVPYAIGIIDTNPNCSKQAWDIIPKDVPFPASGKIVFKVLDAVDNTTTLNLAEFDRVKKEYALFDTITVKTKKLTKGYPLELYAEYKDTSSVYIAVFSGINGKPIGEYKLSIERPVYTPPQPKPVAKPQPQPQRARTVSANPQPGTKEYEQKCCEDQEKEKRRKEIEEEQRKQREYEQKKDKMNNRLASAQTKLDDLVGLESVKESLHMLVSRLEYESMRNEALGRSNAPIECPRFVFNGNPGTGKTTVARLVADICYGCGLLSKGHLVEVSRSELIGEFVGQTGKATKEACNRAQGGVLFVDEAYSLVQKAENDYGQEAIAVLIKEMEDHRNDMVVILAGYTEEMNDLLNTNTGIKSRITDTVTFNDFTTEQLFHIADDLAEKENYKLTPEGRKAFEYLINARKVDRKFGNAREVRTLLDKAISRKAVLYSQGVKESLTELTAEDFGIDLSKTVEVSAKDILKELDALTGLEAVKKNVHQIISKAKYMIREVNDGNMKADQLSLNMNLCFTGNPGTGKTTVARLYAKLLHSIGFTKTDKVYELTRSDLVAPYMGQTALKTKVACEKCYGGVMFIDEAYSLVQGDNDTFGMEALDTLIKEMEDNRDRLVVIFAGYTKEMTDFMEHNSGLKSRIPKFIEFNDYSIDELYSIFKQQIADKRCILDENAGGEVKERIRIMCDKKDRTFGNAREIRNLTEEIFTNMVTRVEENDLEDSERKRIIIDDVRGCSE